MQRKWLISGVLGVTGIVLTGSVPVRAQVSAATGTSTGAASAALTAKAQHEIDAVLRIQCAAMEHRDVEVADRPYTDDYHIDGTPGGTEDKASRDKSTKELFSAAQTLHVQTTTEDVHLSADGKTATLVEKTHLVFTTHPTKTEKSHAVTLDGTASEVWVKTAGPKPTWLKRSKKSLSMTESVDGVPYQPAAPTSPPANQPAPANPPASTNSQEPTRRHASP